MVRSRNGVGDVRWTVVQARHSTFAAYQVITMPHAQQRFPRFNLARLLSLALRSTLPVMALALTLLGERAMADAAPPASKAPVPVQQSLVTRDGVVLVCTYLPGTKEKESTPVILLHEHKGSRRDLEPLGLSLQSLLGCAVIIPDLRGHGDSKVKTGQTKRLEADTFTRAADFVPMAEDDLEAVKRFLVKENNNGRCNIDKLCVVGVQMGASVAAMWGAKDWSWPAFINGKQGQDVKGLVLISAVPNFYGLNLTQALAKPAPPNLPAYRTGVSVMVIAGVSDSKASADAKNIVRMFEQGRKPAEYESDDLTQRTMFTDLVDTKLQGTKLLTESSLALDQKIAAFIKIRAVDQPYPWLERYNQLGEVDK